MDFGRVWGGFWEAKIINFRTFFDVFSKQNLKHVLEVQKIAPRGLKDGSCGNLAVDSGGPRAPGERL